MDFNLILEMIGATAIPASTMIQAIIDGLVYVNQNSELNARNISELEYLLTTVQESFVADNSSPEVVLARSGHTSLDAHLTAIENRITDIDAKIELQQPYTETKTKMQSIPFERTIEFNANLTPDQTYIRQQGVNGQSIIEYDEVYVNGQLRQITNERVISTTPAVNQITVQGTMVLNKTPFRYIRFSNKRAGANDGRFVELEAFVNANNIAKNATVSVPSGATQSDKNAMFDGVKQYYSNNVAHAKPYVQLDFGTARTDITSLAYYLYPLINYDYVYVDVSADGKAWRRMYSKNNHYVGNVGDAITIDVSTLYGTPISTYSDIPSEVPIGGRISLAKPNQTPIYWDSGRAAIRSSSGNYSGSYSTFTVINVGYTTNNSTVTFTRPTSGTYVVLYGTNVGWFRADEIGG